MMVTVKNLQVANLAFSDLCLGVIVLPLSSIYAIANEWLFTSTLCVVFVSADILCSTASIWNLSIVGLDRYWAITTPMAYMAKRNKRTVAYLILSVWLSSALISLAPFFGWKQVAERGNMIKINGTWQCVFLDLPSYTIYSATGSFFIPLFIMFFVYYKIYQTFAKHRARQLYRQQVIKKHIESTILHDLSHVLPTNDKFAKEVEKNKKEKNSTPHVYNEQLVRPMCKECEECVEQANKFSVGEESNKKKIMQGAKCHKDQERAIITTEAATRITSTISDTVIVSENNITKGKKSMKCYHCGKTEISKMHLVQFPKTLSNPKVTYGRKRLHSKRQTIVSQHKPKSISTAKERRGVKVFGIILGCFAICWTPFFIMYVVVQFCSSCQVDPHIWMFITWLGYSNSAMNPIIYTIFNHDYQNALKGLFRGSKQQRVYVKR
uniref:G-protein coupled receptors family 1 profile domain-containing protein n=1 Tax=Wuchereria bancrofti TaxID=6293 RepID=A0AAF5RT12_WUCBA